MIRLFVITQFCLILIGDLDLRIITVLLAPNGRGAVPKEKLILGYMIFFVSGFKFTDRIRTHIGNKNTHITE